MANLSSVRPESSEHEPILSNTEQSVGADGEDTILDSEGDVHIASHAEKKRLWWKNALINAFFILTWYDAPTFIFFSGTTERLRVGSSLQRCSPCITNGYFLRTTLISLSRYS
jgi:hypothetical protein